jgi:hypothetical protein
MSWSVYTLGNLVWRLGLDTVNRMNIFTSTGNSILDFSTEERNHIKTESQLNYKIINNIIHVTIYSLWEFINCVCTDCFQEMILKVHFSVWQENTKKLKHGAGYRQVRMNALARRNWRGGVKRKQHHQEMSARTRSGLPLVEGPSPEAGVLSSITSVPLHLLLQRHQEPSRSANMRL